MAGGLKLHSRRRQLLGVAVLVGAVHLLAVEQFDSMIASATTDIAMAPRLQAIYVRRLELTEPPIVAVEAAAPAVPEKSRPPPATRAEREPAPPAPAVIAASAPAPQQEAEIQSATAVSTEDAPTPLEQPVLSEAKAADVERAAVDPVPPALAETTAADEIAAVIVGGDANPNATPFAWPASTRLNYVLTGKYRGEVHGSAQVEWINAAPRYQVNLDVTIGLPFAPLLSRQMRSDGTLGASGLNPARYDQRSKRAFQDPRRNSLRIDESGVRLEDGRLLALPPTWLQPTGPSVFSASVQDSASQFVQLSFMFSTQPGLLKPGATITFPLALPGRVAPWRYQVGQLQTLYTRFGPVDAYHVFTAPGTDRGRDLLAESWFAPKLAYLPVRIRIEQEADVYLDLMITEMPEIAVQ